MKNLRFILFTVAIATMYGLSSCKEDVVITEDTLTYNRPINLAVPIFNGKFAAQDLLALMQDTVKGNALINVGENGLLYVDYNMPFEYKWDDVITIDRVEHTAKYGIPGAPVLPSSQKKLAPIVMYNSLPLNFLPNQRFDDAIFGTGSISMRIPPVNDLKGAYSITFTGILTESGDSVKFSGNLDSNLDETIDLSGSNVKFVHNVSKTESSLEFRIEMQQPSPTGSNPGSELEISLLVEEIVPTVLSGYFGTVYPLNQEFEMSFPFFNAFNISDFAEFHGLSILLEMDNYFGIPVSIALKNMFMIKSLTGEALEVEFSMGDEYPDNTIPLEGAEYAIPVVPKYESFKIDSVNSNIQEAINYFPDRVKFDAIVKTNPNGEIPGQINFLSESNKFKGNLGLYFPFWFKTSLYQRIDTLGINISELLASEDGSFDPIDVVEFLEIDMLLKNAFPFDLKFQIYPVNDLHQKVDSIFSDGPENLLRAAVTDATGKVDTNSLVPYHFIASITQEQLRKYRDEKVTSLLVYSYLSTVNEGAKFVKLHDFNYVSTKFMFEIKSNNK